MDGFIGRVEFGSMTGSQLAAGRSYQGTLASPCMAGITYGVSFESFVPDVGALSESPCPFDATCDVGASRAMLLSLETNASEKYLCSLHRSSRSITFF